MASVPGSMLNMENIIKKVFDHTTDSLRTSGGGGGPTNIVISSSDDSIAIGNVAGDLMTVNTDGTINVNIAGVTPSLGRLPVDIGGNGSITITSGTVTVQNEVEIKNDVGNPVPVNGTVVVAGVSTLVEQQTQTASLSGIETNTADILTEAQSHSGYLASIDTKLTSPLSITGSTVALDSTTLAALENTTVSGTVTANAGTNLNTSLLALDSTVAKDSSLSTINSSVNSLLKPADTLAAVTSITNTVVVKADTLANQANALKVDGSATTQPISASTLPLPSGASTSALQTAGNSSLSNLDTKTPALGQALAAASTPVVLPTAQITALTPLSSVAINNFPATQPVSAASLPLPTGAATETTVAAVNTKLPTGLTVKAASTPAVAADQALVVTLSPNNPVTATISNASIEISNDIGNPIPVSGTVTANIGTTNGLALDTSVNSLLKPASTLAAVTAVGSITNTVVVKADTLANQTNALKVDGSAITQPISVASLPLPTNAATASNQTTAQTSLNTLVSNSGLQATLVEQQAQTTQLVNNLPVLSDTSRATVLTAGTGNGASPKNIMVGGIYKLAQPTLADGDQSEVVLNNKGELKVEVTNQVSSVSVSNFPATQDVSGSLVSVGNTVDVNVLSSALPTGAATSALQTTGNSSLSSIDTKTPSLGQTTMAASTPVTIASNQSTLPISAAALPLPALAATSTKQSDGTQRTQVVDSANNAIDSVLAATGIRALDVAMSATNYILSTVNSTTAQLASAATFTGTIESIFNQQIASILLTSDQNGTLTLRQYIDVGGTRKINDWVYPVVANVPFSRSFPVNGNFFNLLFTNNGGVATTTLNINTAYGTLAATTNLGNGPVSIDEVNGIAFSLGTKQASLSLPVILAENARYKASAQGIASAATATDVFTITGSATKTIRVTSLIVTGTQTTLGTVPFDLVVRSTANTGGTSVARTRVPLDSTSAAATATVLSYTANPTVGTLVGSINSIRKIIPGAASAVENVPIQMIDTPIILRGITQVLAVNLNSTTVTGGSFSYTVTFEEV